MELVKTILERNRVKIATEYQAGKSTCQLGRELGISNASVYLYLRDILQINIRKVLTLDDCKDDIITLYNKGYSINKISQELQLNNSTVQRYAKKLNLDTSRRKRNRKYLNNYTEDIISQYNNGVGCYTIAKKYDCFDGNILGLLNRNNVKIRPIRTLFFDEYYFHTVDTWPKAYLLGLLCADGSVSCDNYYTVLSLTDIEPVQYLAKCVNYPVDNIKTILPKRIPLKTQYCIKLCSKIMAEDLVKNGCVHNKTYYLNFPSLDIVSEKFIPTFLLGFLDGDGWVSVTKGLAVGFLGTTSMIQSIYDMCTNRLNIYARIDYRPYKDDDRDCFARIVISGRNGIKFLDYIYKDAEFYLPRKYQNYQIARNRYSDII